MNTSQPTQDYTRWNLPEGAKVRLVPGAINDIQFSPDGTQLAVASSIGIWIYDAHTGEELNLLLGHKGSVSSITYFPNEPILASGGRDDTVRLWDVERGVNCKTLQIRESDLLDGVYSIVCQDDGSLLASGCSWGWSLDHNYERVLWVKKFEDDNVSTIISERHPNRVVSVAFSSDGAYLALGSEDGIVHLWDTERGVLSKTLNVPETVILMSPGTKTVKSITFTGDAQVLASGGSRYMCLWDVKQGKLLYQTSFFAVSDGPYSMCFSADRRLFAIEGGSNNIFLYDATMDECLATLTHTERDINNVNVTNLAFSPDSRTLASGNQDGTVLLWDVDSISPPNIIDSREKVILGEEKSEFQDRESQIRQICTERGITTLVHFTRIEHLRNILHEGLLDHQNLLKKHGQQFTPNDRKRLDGYKEAICLSISFPNDLLFSKFRYKYSGGNCSEWVVLLLDTKVLWELDCAFCQENAASNTARRIPLEKRKEPEALGRIFIEVYRDIKIVDGIKKQKIYQRQSMQIPAHYPTHPQAEILVFDQIPSDYIKEVHFYNETALEQWRYGNPGDYPLRLTVNQQYFQYGRDQVVWEDDNLDDDDIPFGSRINDDDDIPF